MNKFEARKQRVIDDYHYNKANSKKVLARLKKMRMGHIMLDVYYVTAMDHAEFVLGYRNVNEKIQSRDYKMKSLKVTTRHSDK